MQTIMGVSKAFREMYTQKLVSALLIQAEDPVSKYTLLDV